MNEIEKKTAAAKMSGSSAHKFQHLFQVINVNLDE